MNPIRLVGFGLTGLALAGAAHRAEGQLVDFRELRVPAAAGAGQHNLTVAPDGRVYLSWIEPRPDSVRALLFSALGSEWSNPRVIAQGRDWFINWADFPSLVATDGGRLVAHWLQRTPGSTVYGVRLAHSSDGGASWSAPLTPHRETIVHAPRSHAYYGFVSLWPEPGGAAGAVWVDSRNTGDAEEGHGFKNLRATTLLANGELGPEVELDGGICDCCQTGAAVTGDGPVIVYRDRTADEIRDIAIVRRVNGAWTAPAIVAADGWRINACPVNGPAVAAEGRRVAVAWYTAAGGTRRVKVAFSDDGGATFGAPAQVDDGRPAGRVGVVLTDDGALVSWLEDTPAGSDVRVRLMARGGGRGEMQIVAQTSAGRPSGFPRMVRSGERVVFAWREPEHRAGSLVRAAVARLAPAGGAGR